MRICLANDSFPPMIDGVANAVLNYAVQLHESGDEPVVATPAYPDVEDDYPFDVLRYPSIDTTKIAGYRTGFPFDERALVRLAKKQPDIIHAHCPIASTLLGRGLRETVGAPLILTYHTKFDLDIKRAIKFEYIQEKAIRALVSNVEACDEVWVVSRGAAENLQSLGYEGETVIMQNGVDLSRGRAPREELQRLRREYDIPQDVPVYLFVGRIIWYKGLAIILEALDRLNRAGRPFRMFFVGDGADRGEAEQRSEALGLGNWVHFVGAEHDRETLRAWYSLADLFLFPSTFDTNGLVVREAAACSTPSVLVKGSCAAEGVEDGKNGFLIEENAGSLTALLQSPAGTRENCRCVGEAASKQLYLSWEESVRHARERYETVLEHKRTAPPRPHARFDLAFETMGELRRGVLRAALVGRGIQNATAKTVAELLESHSPMKTVAEELKQHLAALRDRAGRYL